MDAEEFITQLGSDNRVLVRAGGRGVAPVIVRIGDDDDDADWHLAAYEQFLKDDVPYDALA